MSKKCVLAYSGGLDTSVAIKWMAEKYDVEIIALTVDLGEQDKDLDSIKEKALDTGAVKAITYDVKQQFAEHFIKPAIWANAAYEGKYFLHTSLSRPLIAQKLVEVALAEGAEYVAHGATGKGNDQVRFELGIASLAPQLKVLTPVREWGMTREDEIEYAIKHGIPVPVGKENPFSLDINLYGRACEAGILSDPSIEPPPEAYGWTIDPQNAPDAPEYIDLGFENGVPTHLNGQRMDLVSLIMTLNRKAGAHGVGRIDHVENRLVGIKSREVYEQPAATVITLAHRELESMTLPRELTHFKLSIEHKFCETIYFGLWYHPLREGLQAFFENVNRYVTGTIRLKLFKGHASVAGRQSDRSLYKYELATYDKADQFDHTAARGFIEIFGLPSKVFAAANKK